MSRRLWLGCLVLGTVGVAGVATFGVGSGQPADVLVLESHPPPSIQVLFEQSEEKGKKGRRQWMADLHRAPPDVDWEQVEAANGRARMAARRAPQRAGVAGRWVERGSENQAGSMYAMRLTTDGASWVAGSDLGGLWRGTREGEDWTPLGDGLWGGVHHLWVGAPDTLGDPDVLLVGPTWGTPSLSVDDGVTWDVPTGLADLVGIRTLAGSTDGSDTVFLAGLDGAFRMTVRRSSDGGRSFEEVLAPGGAWGDLWVDRAGGSGVWALGTDALFTSMDGGESWAETPLAESISQGHLAVSEATVPPRVYVMAKDYEGGAQLFRSDDGGGAWRDLGPVPDAWEVLSVSTVDPDLVVYGGVELHRSTDGGRSFEVVNTWDAYYGDPETQLHADIMAVTVTPDGAGAETWGMGTHGGVYISEDGLRSVRNLSLTGLRVSQYYSTLTAHSDPGRVLAGSQDQGLQWATAAPAVSDARFELVQHLSGDFGHLVSSDGEHEWVYGVYPGFVLTFRGEDDGELGFVSYPPDDGFPPWLPVLVASPSSEREFFFLGAHLWRYRFVDDRWEVEQWSEQDFGGTPWEYASAMAFDPLDPERAFLATSLGRTFRSEDGAVTWEALDVVAPEPSYIYSAALVVSGHTPGVVVMGGSGYDGSPVYRSVDGGDTWVSWSEGLPPTVVYSLAELRDGTGRMVAGTETSAWLRSPDSDAWVDITQLGAPLTSYFSAEVLATENTVRMSTFGRGVWDFQLDPQGEGCWQLRDDDLDGVTCELDCDDSAADAFPGAEEQCDGRDTDCDGVTELDEDGDGVWACEDCDDNEPTAFPGATEIDCDGIDNDCDGVESCPSLPEEDEERGGCGCTVGHTAPGWAWLGLALVLARRGR